MLSIVMVPEHLAVVAGFLASLAALALVEVVVEVMHGRLYGRLCISC